MPTLLDLIQEWAVLSEAKTLGGGALTPATEERWGELRDFYDLLMAQDGLCPKPAARYSASEIRRAVSKRDRLRVQTDLEIVVMKSSEIHFARVGNLSCGGVLLLSDAGFPIGVELLLQLSNVSRGAEVMPTDGAIVWASDSGNANGNFRYRMGVEFVELGEKQMESLDGYVVDSLEAKLLSLSRDALGDEFIAREALAL